MIRYQKKTKQNYPLSWASGQLRKIIEKESFLRSLDTLYETVGGGLVTLLNIDKDLRIVYVHLTAKTPANAIRDH